MPTPPTVEQYSPHGRQVEEKDFPRPQDRVAHATMLSTALRQAREQAVQRRQRLDVTIEGAQPGLYIEFESQIGTELKLESLQDRRAGIELVAVQEVPVPEQGKSVQRATVFVPDGSLKIFFKKFEEYASQVTKSGDPKHKELVDRIAALRLATLRALWTDEPELFPVDGETVWWEVWLRRQDGKEITRLARYAELFGLQVGPQRLTFDDRTVVLVRSNVEQLAGSLDVLGDIAELRKPKDSVSFFVTLPSDQQAEWVRDLLQRISAPPVDAPAVCLLDTGITHQHPLLRVAIEPHDATAVDPSWGSQDDGGGPTMRGHGTAMAGLALYGDLATALSSRAPLRLLHRIESVKLLPPKKANEPRLYGAITAQAVARPEITTPWRQRVFAMAVTADGTDRGKPTSWSAALDALAVGRAFDPTTHGLEYLDSTREGRQRLFIVSAGNVPREGWSEDYLTRCDLTAVEDPAQAWNALTVGAFTEKDEIQDPMWYGWRSLGVRGDLSPFSTTSVTFGGDWPIKPEVVFEGGNVATNNVEFDSYLPDLSLLSTYFRPHLSMFTVSCGTSPATAQVARMAAILMAEYPEFWPETVRALLVHSARWTKRMEHHIKAAKTKRQLEAVLRRYGFGVPSLDRALRSANDALTLIVQATLHPFRDGRMNEMHLHDLPWPEQVLRDLGETRVRLRVTLSYFVEPNPSRRGWKGRYRYASHLLRFDIKTQYETRDMFRKKINKKALTEGEAKPHTPSDADEWLLGETLRNKGSIHHDIWEGTAADLAERGVIAVYPVSGWWKDQPRGDRSDFGVRYALVVSIEVDAENVDIWTPVATQIGVPFESQVIIE